MEHRPALEQQSSRRHLTILFADLSSSTWLGDHLDPEEFEDLLAQVYDLYERIIGRHNGRMAQVQGDGVFAVFGHPQPAEQDCWHAVTAALEMRDAARALQTPYLRRLNHQLDMHSGIHSGLVLFSAGDDLLGRYRLVGDATNVAHRLSDVAEAGEVLVSATTLGPHQHLFDLGASRQLELAGKRRSQLAWNIIGPAAVDNAFAARDSAGLTRFVGRQREMDELNSRLLKASEGVPTVIAIVAPAGIGKTRLATELLSGATAGLWQHHRGYCESYLGAAPLQPFRQMAAQLLATTVPAPGAEHAAAQTPAVDSLPTAMDQQLVRAIAEPSDERSVSHAFCQLLSDLAKTRPQLVFVDDFQWADQASVEVVDAISRLEGLPILVLLTTRDRSHLGAIAANIVELPLQELAPPALRAAAESLLQHPDPFTLADVCVRAGGNPLFLEEICHAYSRDPTATSDTPASTAWLDILIESRFAQLPDADARIVRAAAVIGLVAPIPLLGALLGSDPDPDTCQRLAAADFLFLDDVAGALRFKHGITQRVIYECIGLVERRALHAQIAATLAAADTVSQAGHDHSTALAHHYFAAADYEQAATHAERAGDQALALSALDLARSQFEAALSALDALPATPARQRQWQGIIQRLGWSCVFDPAPEQLHILSVAAQRARDANDDHALAHAEYWLSYVQYALGHPRLSLQHGTVAIAAARSSAATGLEIQAISTVAQSLASACRYEEALTQFEVVTTRKREHQAHTKPSIGSAYALACKGTVLGDLGQFDLAYECFDTARDAVARSGHELEGSVLALFCAVSLWQGRWHEAVTAARRAMLIADRTRSLYVMAMDRALEGFGIWQLQAEQADNAANQIARATTWLQERGKSLFVSLNYGWLAEIAATQARPEQARHYAASALARARQQDLLGAAMAYRALTETCWQSGDLARAEHYLGRADAIAERRQSRHELAVNQLHRARHALICDEFATGREILHGVLPDFEAMAMHWHEDQAVQLLAACDG